MNPMTCPRCDTGLHCVGTKKFHEGARGRAYFELFVDSIGEQYRPR